MHSACLSAIGPTCHVTPISRRWTRATSPTPTSGAAGSRVRTSASLARAPASLASDQVSGGHGTSGFAWYDRASSSWKTWQRSLFGGWETYSEPFPHSGTMRSGIASGPSTLAPLTGACGSSSSPIFPTPSATPYGTNQGGGMGRVGPARPSLSSMAKSGMWPTPRASDAERGGRGELLHVVKGASGPRGRLWPTPTAGDSKASGSRNTPQSKGHSGTSLTDWVRGDGGAGRTTWASPSARDWRSGAGREDNGHTPQLAEQVGGQLNPTWVEWLQGFPTGWTACDASATPSSPSAPKSSGAGCWS